MHVWRLLCSWPKVTCILVGLGQISISLAGCSLSDGPETLKLEEETVAKRSEFAVGEYRSYLATQICHEEGVL